MALQPPNLFSWTLGNVCGWFCDSYSSAAGWTSALGGGIVPGRRGYLGEGVHVAPGPEQALHAVQVDSFGSRVQSREALLEHTNKV